MSCSATDGPDLASLPFPAKDRDGNPVAPTWHMRERLAAALDYSRPAYMHKFAPECAYGHFLFMRKESRQLREEWADEFLRSLDYLGLAIVDRLIPEQGKMRRANKQCRTCPFRGTNDEEKRELAKVPAENWACHSEGNYWYQSDIQCRGHWEAQRRFGNGTEQITTKKCR